MVTAKLSTSGRPNVWWESDPTVRVRADFPLSAANGCDNSAVVYFELEPGKMLGRHTDSAEEILLVLQGTVEATVGEESDTISQGEMAVVPAMVPHSVRNTGSTVARVVGFFSSGTIVATFDEPFMPTGQQVFEL